MQRASSIWRRALTSACVAVVVACGGGSVAATPDVPTLGNPRAPVTIMEFASVGCPHCAVWANNVFPDFRHKYIDTGRVRFEFHEMITGNPALAMLGFLTARCATPDRYFQVVDDIFAQQDEIGRGGIDVLAKIGERAGVIRPRFETCLHDEAAVKALSERTQQDAKAHGITGTPTFIVGGERLDGEQTLEQLDAAIARAHH